MTHHLIDTFSAPSTKSTNLDNVLPVIFYQDSNWRQILWVEHYMIMSHYVTCKTLKTVKWWLLEGGALVGRTNTKNI